MELSVIINIVGITAYSLLAIFFLWVMLVPNILSRTFFWLISVLAILFGRLNLYFLPEYLAQQEIQTIYMFLLIVEKVFLVLGLYYFFNKRISLNYYVKVFSFAITAFVLIIGLKYGADASFIAMIVFSTCQAFFLLYIMKMLYQKKKHMYLNQPFFILSLFVFYAIHWLTYPIALNYPLWLTYGYLFGNVLNLIIYLYLAYLVLERFQYRMLKAETSALELLDEAKKANRTKSEFLANMSHEIRTPINGVMGMLELLQDAEMKTEYKEKINIAFTSSKILLDVVNEVLDYSKIEAGKLSLEYIEFDLINLFTEVFHTMENLANNKALSLTLDTDLIISRHVKSDPLRIKQILFNLIGNAIKFTEEGEIIVKAEQVHKANVDYLVCSIIDTGVGIDEDKLATVFESFQQADSSTTRNFGGSGLGLSISKQLSQLLKGDITVESVENQGSKFTVTIPLEIIEDFTFESTELDTTDIPKWQENTKILLVEDNRINQVVAIQLLKSFNLVCDVAENGAIAIAKLKLSLRIDTPYTCILMDCQMPTLDGYETTKRIRSGECGGLYKKIPIIAMTANAMTGDREKCLATGMNDFISKPIEREVMSKVLKSWISEK
ncbi:ATP-binding protein [Thalassotalea castellviae]|uniref:histidine kinase n=1 Tax=Thalassotalea castellviae TaxID=3075612 RepID=A0ABU2ZVS0_9GAMM|nr:ATP-binding protein [Thalassotalea sp. W431]MDT0602031.1 ATP-binding protein [Thalassotalea sp. W431]